MKTITPAEYQRLALKTERTPEYMRSKSSVLDDQQLARLDHAIKGLVTEAAELQDAMKRHLIYTPPHTFFGRTE